MSSILSNNPIRKTMSLIDEHKDNLPEGVYLEICDNLKSLYLTGGDAARDTYLLDLTNEYYSLLEDNESLRHQLVEQKRELLRANVSRFERVTRPAVIQPRGMLESILFDPQVSPNSVINPVSSSNFRGFASSNEASSSMDTDTPSPFVRGSATRIGRR
tara:strand:+ start:4685 stop:5161 length:477 start_codon:yes stop_codon:yes gene_type:complete